MLAFHECQARWPLTFLSGAGDFVLTGTVAFHLALLAVLMSEVDFFYVLCLICIFYFVM